MLTQDRLKELIYYDPETGVFTRLVRTTNRVHVGDVAGTIDQGYRRIRLLGICYSAHRLAFLYMIGRFPTDKADHINGIRSDNRWANLREATHSINAQNQRRPQKRNKLGLLGVHRHGIGFRALLYVDGANKSLGTYKTPELAYAAYLEAKRKLHPGCTI